MADYNWENARSLRTGLQFSTLTLLIIDNLRNISFARNRQFNVKVQPKKYPSFLETSQRQINRCKLKVRSLFKSYYYIRV